MDIPPLIRKYIDKLPYVIAHRELIDAFGYTDIEAAEILNIKTFKDLNFKHHPSIPITEYAVSAYIEFPDGKWISVVGGDNVGLYGNGKTSFEVYSSEMEDPEGWLSIEDVNDILIDLQDPKKEK
jgi:hypothetical protein